jgi:hypothetical protein
MITAVRATRAEVIAPMSRPSQATLARGPLVQRQAPEHFWRRLGHGLLVGLAILSLLVGYLIGQAEIFTPAEGVGYWIGIAGGAAMLLLLLYSMRKRFRFMRRLGAIPKWFRLHMILGVTGPILVLYHCNFKTGATNSNVALAAMLLVAGSGLVGRYIYRQIHNGMSGAHSTVQELLEGATALVSEIERDVGGAGGAIALELTRFGTVALRPRKGVAASFTALFTIPISANFARSRIMAEVRSTIRRNAPHANWSRAERRAHLKAGRQHVRAYLGAIAKAAELSFYERLFSLWHILHVPLFFLLLVTGIVHVVAVHMY